QKPADIGGRSRESKKTSDDVDLVFECVGGMARSGVRTEHVEEGAGVEVAAAGAHDQAAGRGEPHGRVARNAVVERNEARSSAEVREDSSSMAEVRIREQQILI